MGKKSKKKTKQGASSTLDTVETVDTDGPAIDDNETKTAEAVTSDVVSVPTNSDASVNLTCLLQAEAAVADAEAEAAGAAARAAKAQVDAAAFEETTNDDPNQSDESKIGAQTNPLGAANPPLSASAPTAAVEASVPINPHEASLKTPAATAGAAMEAPPLKNPGHTSEPASVSSELTTAPVSEEDPEATRKAKLLAEQAARRAQYEAARAEAMEVLNGYNAPPLVRSSSPTNKLAEDAAVQGSATASVQQPVAPSAVQEQNASAKPVDQKVDAGTAQVAAQATQLKEDLDPANNEDEDEEVREEDLDDVDLGSFDRKSSFRQNGNGSFNKGGSKPPVAIEKSKWTGKPQSSEADYDEDEGGDSMGVACDVKRACMIS